MAIADYLKKLKQQQNDLITAVNNKGGKLSDGATLDEIVISINDLIINSDTGDIDVEITEPSNNLLSPENVEVRYGGEIISENLTTILLGQDQALKTLDNNILRVGEHGGGLTISGIKTEEGQKLTFSFDYEVLQGTLKTMGGYADVAYENNVVYIDGERQVGFFWTSEPGAPVDKKGGAKGTVKVEITAKQNGGANLLTIQPNKGTGVFPVTFRMTNLKLIEGI